MSNTSWQPSSDIDKLRAIMKLLRSPQGCPWDREQTKASLVPHTLEEAYEVADAVASGNVYKICEELGDLLLQVVFYCQIAEEQGEFCFEDVVQAISAKLIRRHPHIFGDAKAETPGEVNALWAEVKARETGTKSAEVPPLPGLLLLEKIAGKADAKAVKDPLLQQLLILTKQAKQEGRNLEAEIRRFCANFWR